MAVGPEAVGAGGLGDGIAGSPSTSTWGSSRSSHRGSHQLRSPSSSIVAGTSTMRTTVASTNTAVARPMPASLRNTASSITKAPNTVTMIAAAAVITRAVLASPSATARRLSPVRTYSSRTRDRRNTS